MTPSAEIRRALPEDRTPALETITAAFGEDPAWGFLTDGEYPRLAPLLAAASFDLRVGGGNVWVSETSRR